MFLYISTARIPGEKANTYQVLQMCDAFSSHGLSTTLLHPQRDNYPEMQRIQNIHTYYGLNNQFPIIGLPTIDWLLTSEKLLQNSPRLLKTVQNRLHPLLLYSYRKSIRRYLQLNAFDFYYTRSPIIAQTVQQALPSRETKVFCELHALPSIQKERSHVFHVLHSLTGIVAVTSQLKERCIQGGLRDENIIVAPDGVNLELFKHEHVDRDEARKRLQFPPRRFLIGYVGRLQTLGLEKGIRELIEALSLVIKTNLHTPLTLICVGGPDEMAKTYGNYGRQLGLDKDSMRFLPHVPPTEIPIYLSAFDLCVMPFPWNEHYAYYMSPLKLFEYMASNRPILATKLPSVMEILRHKINAYLAEPGDPKSLAEGIRWIIAHPQAAGKLAYQASQDVIQYSWEQRAAKILRFMRQKSGNFEAASNRDFENVEQ